MAGLSVIFKAVDKISSQFDAMSSAGTKALDSFNNIEDAADKVFSNITEGTKKAADAMDKAASTTDSLSDALCSYNKDSVQTADVSQELADAGSETESVIDQTAETMERATEEIGKLSDATQKMSEEIAGAGEAAKEAGKKTKEYGEESEEAGKKTKGLGKESEETGKKSKEAIEGLNDVLAAVGIVSAIKAITDSFYECSEAASTFETSVAMVSTVADTSVLSAGQLSDQISQLSSETAKDVNELADATYNAISAGVATENAVNIVGEATKLATAGFTSSSSALSVLTTALNAYQLEASEVTNISDSLITSQNLGVMTIDQLSSSMGKAISTASAYSIDLYNLESGYISLTKAGVSVEESTTYLSSMFNELGKSSSGVSKILVEETGQSFGQLMESGYTLADVLEILYNSVNQNSEALMNLWGSAEAGKAANAVINQGLDTFNSNLNKLANSAGTTQAAYEAMTDTTAYSTERLQNSFDNLQIVIGDDLNPVLNDFKNGIADVVDGLTIIIKEHPAVTAALTALTSAITIIVVGLGGYLLAMKAATLATTAWTAVLDMNPVFLAITAVTALAAAVAAFTTVLGDSEDEYYTWTYTTRKQYDELENLKTEYENACEVYGDTSEEALRLKYQVDELTDSFDDNKRTMEEFIDECDRTIESCESLSKEYEDNMNTIHNNELGTAALIQRLEDLATSTDITSAKQMEMEAIIAELNSQIDGLNLSYGKLTDNQGTVIESLKEYAEEQAKQERMQAQYDAYVKSICAEADAQEELIAVKEELADAQEAYNKAEEEYLDYVMQVSKYGTPGGTSLAVAMGPQGTAIDTARENLDKLKSKEDELNTVIEEQQKIQADCEEAWDNMAKAADEATKASDGYTEVTQIVNDYQKQLDELCEAYDAAYQSALDSIQGQYGLWEKADKVTAMSTSNIQTALQSQLDYWNSYNENMDTLTAKTDQIEGLSDMLADLADGSADSAAMLKGMAKMNDTDLSAVVQQYLDLQSVQSDTATSVADLETKFTDKLNNIQSEMENTVESMDMSDEAKTNAKSTMDAYVNEIEEGVLRAQKAIDSLTFANAKGGYKDYATQMTEDDNGKDTGVPGYAVGTSDAEPGLALVGEEGPELVNFGGGEVVYTADETANILSKDTQGITENEFYVAPPDVANDSETGTIDKNITLKIEGSGEMKVGGNGGVSKEDIVSVLMDNIKDALMNIIQQEIMEEGDLIYDY